MSRPARGAKKERPASAPVPLDPAAPLAELLPNVLAAWQAARQPEVAELVEAVAAMLLAESPRPQLGASKKTLDREVWADTEAKHDLLDFGRLMTAARGGSQDEVRKQVAALAKWQHPSFAQGLLTLLEDPPYAGIKSRPLLEFMFEALEATRDVRAVAPARALAKRYLGIVHSSTGGMVVEALGRAADALGGAKPAPLCEEDARARDAILARLPQELLPVRREVDAARPTVEQLLAVVYKHPEDDDARLVLADALLEAEDEYGELIQLQIGQARGTLTPAQEERLRSLATSGRLASWAQPVSMSGECLFERGFPSAITLYKTANKSLGAPGWATIRRVNGIEKLSTKGAVELLDHPSLAGVTGVGSLSRAAFSALGDRERPWTSLSLRADTSLGPQELAKVRRVERLELMLSGDPAAANSALLESLPHLTDLDLRLHGTDGVAKVRIPKTVTSAVVHGELAPGCFADAACLRKLRLWAERVGSGVLRGLEALTTLQTSAAHFDADVFEDARNLESLRIGMTGQMDRQDIAREIFRPLTGLRHLDVSYMRLAAAHLAGAVGLESLRGYWTNVEDVPALPQLENFHCMMPREVAPLADLVRRCPKLRAIAVCWNSSSHLWFSSMPEAKNEKPWKELVAFLNDSRLESFGTDAGIRLLRAADGAWSRLSLAGGKSQEWGYHALVRHVLRTFPIREVQDIPPGLDKDLQKELAAR